MRKIAAVVVSIWVLYGPTDSITPLASQRIEARGRPVVVFIHGRAQAGRTQDEMVREWFGAFRDGLDKLGRRQLILDTDLSMVRYEWIYERDYEPTAACTLRPLHAPLALNEQGLRAARGMLSARPPAEGGQAATSLEQAVELTHQRAQQAELWRLITSERRSAAEAFAVSGRLNRILNVLSERARRLPGGARFATNFLRDTRIYLTGGQHQCDTNRVLADTLSRIFSAGRPIVLVAHSMGGIVLFSHLHQNSQAPYSVNLISVGSQIGVPDLLPMIFGSAVRRPILPRQIVSWSNIHGRHDYIGFGIDRNAFLTQGLVPFSDLIVDTGDRDPHAIREYLQHRAVALAISRAWCGAFVNPARRPPGCNNL